MRLIKRTALYVGGNPILYTDPTGQFVSVAVLGGYGLVEACVAAAPYIAGGAAAIGTYFGLKALWNEKHGGKSQNKKNGEQRPSKTPNSGAPGSTHVNPGSGQVRHYGPDGLPVKDIDFDHDHGQGIPHVHDWGRGPNGEPVRGPGRPYDHARDN